MFWPGHCEHSGIKKKTPTTSKKGVGGIAVASSLSTPMRGEEKTLVQKLGKIMSESIPKIGEKEVSAGRGFPYTNSGVCKPKKE